jgi:hypothetical protein
MTKLFNVQTNGKVFALKEEDAMKAADFAAAQKDVTSTRVEMEELLDSHQGVVHKMKTLQVRLNV